MLLFIFRTDASAGVGLTASWSGEGPSAGNGGWGGTTSMTGAGGGEAALVAVGSIIIRIHKHLQPVAFAAAAYEPFVHQSIEDTR